MKFRHPSENNKSVEELSEDTKAARRKAQSTFIKFCSKFSSYLLVSTKKNIFIISFFKPALKKLVDRSNSLFQNKELLSQELGLQYESFILISNGMNSSTQQNQFLSYLLKKHEERFLSKQVQDCKVT